MEPKRVETLRDATHLRAHVNALLAIAVHARIAAAEPLLGAATSRATQAPELPPPRRLVSLVVQWTILAAAITAPWILLLTS